MPCSTRPLIIGVGNPMRSDDGAGHALVTRMKRTHGRRADFALASGEGGVLMALWEGRSHVIVVDAVCSGSAAGTLHRIEAHRERVPSMFFNYSTHAFSLAEAVELSRTLGTLPEQLILIGVEGERFESGDTFSPPVLAALAELTRLLPLELAHRSCTGATA